MGMWSNYETVLKARWMLVIRDPNQFLAMQVSNLSATLNWLVSEISESDMFNFYSCVLANRKTEEKMVSELEDTMRMGDEAAWKQPPFSKNSSFLLFAIICHTKTRTRLQ